MEAIIVYWDYIGTLDRKWKLLHHYRVYIGVILGFYWEGAILFACSYRSAR